MSIGRTGVLVSAALLELLCIGGCQKAGGDIPRKTVTIDRQVIINDLALDPKAIIRTGNGAFVVAGVGPSASAFTTDIRGELLWEYSESAGTAEEKSALYGIVELANGNLLFCGSKRMPYKQTINRLVEIDSKGHVVGSRSEVPGSDNSLISSGFSNCFKWHDGIVVTGSANNAAHAYTWILRCDNQGKRIGETLLEGVAAGVTVARRLRVSATACSNRLGVISISKGTRELG